MHTATTYPSHILRSGGKALHVGRRHLERQHQYDRDPHIVRIHPHSRNRADAVAAGVQRIHHDHVGPLVCLFLEHLDAAADGLYATARSEERRVGKESAAPWPTYT